MPTPVYPQITVPWTRRSRSASSVARSKTAASSSRPPSRVGVSADELTSRRVLRSSSSSCSLESGYRRSVSSKASRRAASSGWASTSRNAKAASPYTAVSSSCASRSRTAVMKAWTLPSPSSASSPGSTIWSTWSRSPVSTIFERRDAKAASTSASEVANLMSSTSANSRRLRSSSKAAAFAENSSTKVSTKPRVSESKSAAILASASQETRSPTRVDNVRSANASSPRASAAATSSRTARARATSSRGIRCGRRLRGGGAPRDDGERGATSIAVRRPRVSGSVSTPRAGGAPTGRSFPERAGGAPGSTQA
mmetsp:Transcript_5187/g.21366  ORF Transcript_5187/g.21366 Transcript_5187/m.21366 type:complete len:311 (+) Transcript_5187:1793-2725(+)